MEKISPIFFCLYCHRSRWKTNENILRWYPSFFILDNSSVQVISVSICGRTMVAYDERKILDFLYRVLLLEVLWEEEICLLSTNLSKMVDESMNAPRECRQFHARWKKANVGKTYRRLSETISTRWTWRRPLRMKTVNAAIVGEDEYDRIGWKTDSRKTLLTSWLYRRLQNSRNDFDRIGKFVNDWRMYRSRVINRTRPIWI